MKILFISECFDEMVDNKSKGLFFIKSLFSQAALCKGDFSAEVLDLSDVSVAGLTVSGISDVTGRVNTPVGQFDIIHTFSVLPFVFRNFFPQLIISSFDIESIDEKFKRFIPEKDEPGYLRYDIATIESKAICELYTDVYNNRRKFDERPWGWWRSLILSEGYKVKQIYVAPDAKLSLQTHKFRSEIWVIAQGNGWVTVGEKKMNAERGSVFNIKRGDIHRAEGGTNGLYIIELQIGEYLGEDDIIRLEDVYGRK